MTAVLPRAAQSNIISGLSFGSNYNTRPNHPSTTSEMLGESSTRMPGQPFSRLPPAGNQENNRPYSTQPSPPGYEPSHGAERPNSVIVDHLPLDVTEQDLQSLLIIIPGFANTQINHEDSYAICYFNTHEDAVQGEAALQGKTLRNYILNAQLYKYLPIQSARHGTASNSGSLRGPNGNSRLNHSMARPKPPLTRRSTADGYNSLAGLSSSTAPLAGPQLPNSMQYNPSYSPDNYPSSSSQRSMISPTNAHSIGTSFGNGEYTTASAGSDYSSNGYERAPRQPSSFSLGHSSGLQYQRASAVDNYSPDLDTLTQNLQLVGLAGRANGSGTFPRLNTNKGGRLTLDTSVQQQSIHARGSPATAMPVGSSMMASPVTHPMSAQSPNSYFPLRLGIPAANPADQNPPCNTLYVGNLPPDTKEDELKLLFQRQRGYKRMSFKEKVNGPMCFVEFEDVSHASRTLLELYGYALTNSTKSGIRLSFSKNPLGVRAQMSPMQGNKPKAYDSFGTATHAPPGLSFPSAQAQGPQPPYNPTQNGMSVYSNHTMSPIGQESRENAGYSFNTSPSQYNGLGDRAPRNITPPDHAPAFASAFTSNYTNTFAPTPSSTSYSAERPSYIAPIGSQIQQGYHMGNQ